MPSLEHIGIAVDEVDAAVEQFRTILGVRPYKAETVSAQQVRTHFLDAGSAKLELLEALDEDSPVQRFLDRQGAGLHHLAFEVAEIEATMECLREAGFTLLSDSPQQGADDKRIFFVHPKQTHGVLVEFCESTAPTWTPKTVPHRGGSLSVFERGNPERPSLLVLHGAAGCTLYETAPLIRRLEASYHVIGIDLSGHGSSSFPQDAPLSLDVFVDDVRAVADALSLSSTHVFGFSLGGAVALRLAQRVPNLVDRLGLFQTSVEWTDDLVSAMMHRLDFETLRSRNPDRAERLQNLHDQPNRLFQQLRAFVKTLPDTVDRMTRGLNDLYTPVLIASVDRDPLFGLDAPKTLHHHLPNARLALLPGEHHSLVEAPLPLLGPLLRRHFDA